MSSFADDKYTFFESGELHVKHTNSLDASHKFRCKTQNRLTNETSVSKASASIILSSKFICRFCHFDWSLFNSLNVVD